MTSTSQQYLTNTGDAVLILRNGTLEIPPMNYALIYPEDMSAASLQNLVDLGLAKVSADKPGIKKTKDSTGPEISTHTQFKGFTLEELRADDVKVAPSVEGVTSSAIGTPPEEVKFPAETEVKEVAKKAKAKKED